CGGGVTVGPEPFPFRPLPPKPHQSHTKATPERLQRPGRRRVTLALSRSHDRLERGRPRATAGGTFRPAPLLARTFEDGTPAAIIADLLGKTRRPRPPPPPRRGAPSHPTTRT